MQPCGPGYRTQSSDTSIVAEQVQFDCYRALSPAEKLEIIEQIARDARALSLAGLRLRHPQATQEELELREAALRLGPELARAIHGARYDELFR
jgi:hypothetical protein